MGFGLKRRSFGFSNTFSVKPDNYDITNKYYFSDGSGEYSWKEFLTATGSFFDDFSVYDIVNSWNEDANVGTATVADSILTLNSGAGAGNFYHNYSVYLSTDTLRNIGKITFEARFRRNNLANADWLWLAGLGNTHQDDDVPNKFIAWSCCDTDTNSVTISKGNGATYSSITDTAHNNNTWGTFKIIVQDAVSPTIKCYIDGSLKYSGTIDKLFRDLDFFAFFQVNKSAGGATTLEIAWVKVTEG